MSKLKKTFVCQQCAASFPKWQGQCGSCQSWNSLSETQVVPSTARPARGGFVAAHSELVPLQSVRLEKATRLETGLAELNHVLGGGLVAGSVVLVGGDPGIGKSTLLLQALCYLGQSQSVLYVTGEESLQQVAMRAQRLSLSDHQLTLLSETQVERILQLAEQHSPKVMVIDSIQTIHTESVSAAPGGVSQVRESAAALVYYAKQRGVALFLVGHVTKEGTLAGPRVLEHMVDTVLYFEGDSQQRYRVMRAVKNRFGAVNELGVFAMTDKGLKPVLHPSAIFLSRYQTGVPGSVVMVSWEGSRPLLIEIQALVDASHLSQPRRVTVGLDHNRLAMLLAILSRHAGIATHDQDIFINAVGGLRVTETGSDLAVVVAVLSSLRNRFVQATDLVFGEMGLSGEIRPVPGGEARLKEAKKHGFKRAFVPKANVPKRAMPDFEVIGIDTISELLAEDLFV